MHNHAERRSLQKAGLLAEGNVRGAQHRDHTWHDLILFGLTRTDWNRGQAPTT